jgi:hypothetical protein
LKIAHQDNRSLAICLGTFLALIWLLFISNVLSVDALYYGGISSTLVLLFMALRGYFPFDREGHIRSGVFWAVLVMLASLPLSTMINSRVILFWYPTNSDLWAVLPYAIVGSAFWWKKLALYPRDDQ